jgi:hypothetical protein
MQTMTRSLFLLVVAVTMATAGCKNCSSCGSSSAKASPIPNGIQTAAATEVTRPTSDSFIKQAAATQPADNCNT